MANITKTIYAPNSSAVQEVDIYASNGTTLLKTDKYTNGQKSSVSWYDSLGHKALTEILAADGRTATEYDQFFYNSSGILKEEKIFTGNGQLSEIDLFNMGALGTKYVFTATGITESDYNAAGTLSWVVNYDGWGNLLSASHYAANGNTITETDLFNGNILAAQELYNNIGQVQTVNLFSRDGRTIIETDTYNYNASGQIAKETHTSKGTLFETDTYAYTGSALSTITKANATGTITEVDYFNAAGKLDHIVHPAQPPAPTGNGNAGTSPPATIPSVANWSSVSGYGEVDVLKALDIITGQTLADVRSTIPLEWGLTAAHFQDAWAAGYTGRGVVIADIDTGIDLHNTSLTHNLSQYDWNFLNNSANVQDDNGHGSCTASELIATNTGNGVVGGAYDAQLMVLKAIDASGSGTDTNIIAAINYAVAHGANIINMSLGGTSPDTILETAVQNATNHGVLVCIAAGNDGGHAPEYPAAYAKDGGSCIAVGASQQAGTGLCMTSFSNQAGSSTPYCFVDAPGSAILGYNQHGQVLSWGGTSLAAPLVAAEAAILESANHAMSATQILQDIEQATMQIFLAGTTKV
ncbi:MAG: S8 family serine peptidase [Deltaproteobacteria bacterium]|nr:S8 family serine peptidase [Deltaproteobacteria bacterium]